ncbi:iron complex transport system ATP-binding protein [Oceanihabitans sediminis]|uniref:ABC transporter ATP-binding protein n=2 Tax=Oceanihabitans sediminis TaxID=1812012 RepID=A0A368P3K0_9FLAO|nr:ABC transporter ATP-binding protein [Oceanihabitans sediminis]RBP29049.1 iron complex transport system ATP-binding protein [Oceanihabitans sediminis]RCU57023.1 ABC transporter ATP-binding protein [Oceanihabitans sediminis]
MENKNQHIILETKNLSVGYKTKKEEKLIASNINIALQKGQLIGLVGANGIGKSTLLRSLTQVQAKLSGEILLNDKPLASYSNLELAKSMSLVLTEKVASKNLSVFELIALGRQPYTNWVGTLSEEDIAVINKAIAHTNIEELKNKKCFELSDGQLQKVMITRALAQDTDLIILDEPTTHLDMYHKAYILKLLQKLVKETGKTILFSSHEIDLAIQLCDSMIVMNKKEVVSDSPCKLISKGVFNNLFPEDLITFDVNTGSFRVKK